MQDKITSFVTLLLNLESVQKIHKEVQFSDSSSAENPPRVTPPITADLFMYSL